MQPSLQGTALFARFTFSPAAILRLWLVESTILNTCTRWNPSQFDSSFPLPLLQEECSAHGRFKFNWRSRRG